MEFSVRSDCLLNSIITYILFDNDITNNMVSSGLGG